MDINEYHLDQTKTSLQGPTIEQIIVYNQWAATALDRYHQNSQTRFSFTIDSKELEIVLNWNSEFSKDAMRERKNIAENGGVALAMFVMSVLLDYHYLQQSEIGEGVDYRFQKERPNSDNFMQDSHFIEISGLLEETAKNKLSNRIKDKHKQIDKGIRRNGYSSVIVTQFDKPLTIKETHQ